MKKYVLFFLASFLVGATLFGQTVTTVPAPIVASGTAKIVLKQSTGTDFYIYTWAVAGTTNYPAAAWADTQVAAFKFVNDGAGVFSFSIASLKVLYKLSDAQLLTVTKIGLIIKNADGSKLTPNDLLFDVSQAPIQQYGGGNGTVGSPYLIANTADLSKLSTTSSDWGMAFKVTAPITATNVTATIGSSSLSFTGSFDGNFQDISGSTLVGSNDIGFFGVVEGATISNVSLKGISVTATGNSIGGLIGTVKGASLISNCSVAGTVSSDGGAVGGFIGQLIGGSLSSNFVMVNVTSKYGSAVGGFVGLASGATAIIGDSYATGSVSGISSSAIGGFVGKLDGGSKISNCYATGNVSSANDYVGGFVGANYSTIENSFSTTATITSIGKYVAQFGGNNNGENISTGNLTWNGTTLASGTFSGSGESGSAKIGSVFNNQTTYSTLPLNLSSSKWRFDISAFPALITISGQSYPFPFSKSTALVNTAVKANVTAFPTLVSDKLTLVGSDVVSYSVTNLLGSTVIMRYDLDRSQAENVISLGELNQGVYIVRVVTANGAASTFKVIKK